MRTEREIVSSILNKQVVESPELLGKECIGCRKILEYNFFTRDSSYRDGRRDLCDLCASTPRLSVEEHIYRLREMNNNSEAVKSQRWEHQDDYRDDASRWGRAMYSGDFLRIIKEMAPSLYFTDGRVENDVSVFQTSGVPRLDWGGKDYRYLFYVPSGLLPEYSLYEFDPIRDIPIKEKLRGWRTPLIRLIESRILTEEDCNEVFGRPDGPASVVWNRHMKNTRR